MKWTLKTGQRVKLELGIGRISMHVGMAKRRKRYESGFKARVALEALKERDTIAVIAKRFGVHSALIHQWKKRLVEEAGSVVDAAEQRTEKAVSQAERLRAEHTSPAVQFWGPVQSYSVKQKDARPALLVYWGSEGGGPGILWWAGRVDSRYLVALVADQ